MRGSPCDYWYRPDDLPFCIGQPRVDSNLEYWKARTGTCAQNWLPRGWDLCRRRCNSKADYRAWRGKTLVCYEPYTVCHDFCE